MPEHISDARKALIESSKRTPLTDARKALIESSKEAPDPFKALIEAADSSAPTPVPTSSSVPTPVPTSATPLTMAERIALFEGENVREGSPFARGVGLKDPLGAVLRAVAKPAEVSGVGRGVVNLLDEIAPDLVLGPAGDVVLEGLERARLIPEAGGLEQTGEAVGIPSTLFGGGAIDAFNNLRSGNVIPDVDRLTEDPRDALERQRGRGVLPRLASEALNPVDLFAGAGVAAPRLLSRVARTAVTAPDVAQQTASVFESVGAVLKDAGAQYSNLTQVTAFIGDPKFQAIVEKEFERLVGTGKDAPVLNVLETDLGGGGFPRVEILGLI